MTDHLPDDTSTAAEALPVAPSELTAKSRVPAFKFPFAPANFAPRNQNDQPWQGKGKNPRHEKKIGMAPNGTRRSMGKR